jgi:hypothetical protein
VSAPIPKTVLLPFTPYAHQRAAHALLNVVRFLVLVWHRRGGKTVFSIVELVLAALACTLERGRYGYIAPQLKQAKGVAWDYLQKFARCIPGTVVNQSELSVEFPNGARVRLFGADNPDSFRGLYFDGVVIDEVADIKPNLWGEIIRPALADRKGWAIFIGTPKGINLFSELFFTALKGDDPDWGTDMRRAEDTGVIDAEELEKARRSMTPAQWAQEMDCDFNASVDNVLLLLTEVRVAQERTLALKDYTYAAKVLGVDVARYGDDKTVLQARQGLVAFKPKVIDQADTMTVAAAVCFQIDTFKPDGTFVDVGGIGAGVVDRCQQLGYRVVPVNFAGRPTQARFENKRAEMWWDMAQWVKQGGCLPSNLRLQQDLVAPRFTYANSAGKLQLESKDDMRARGLPSTDFGDALACTFFAPVVPMDMRGTDTRRDPHPLEGL